MKIKVTQRLTYPEARKVYDQHTPEFSFSKIVQTAPPKPATTDTSTQFNETNFKITASSKIIIPRKSRQNENSQTSTTQKSSYEQTNVQMKNQPNTNPKSRPNTTSSRVQKGSDDPIQQHNRFGVLAEDGAMETDESGHPSSRGSRPRSPIKAPK